LTKQLLALAAIAALAASPADAATIVQSHDIATATTDTFSFDKFDSNLGALDSVTLSFDGTVNVLGTITNNSNANKTFTLSENVVATLAAAGINLSTKLLSGTTQYTLAKKSDPIHSASVSLTGTGSDTDTLTSGLSAFIGTGNLAVTFNQSSSFGASPTSGILSLIPNTRGKTTLTYNYTAFTAPQDPVSTGAVPEAATWAMMILGFASIGALLRRRQTQADALITD
jgi:hypothetical protein